MSKPRTLAVGFFLAFVVVMGVVTLIQSIPSFEPETFPEGTNAYALVNTIFADTTDPATRLELLPEIRGYSNFGYPGGEASFADAFLKLDPPPTIPNPDPSVPVGAILLAPYREGARALLVESIFLLVQGRRTEALDLLLDLHCMGQLMAQGNLVVFRAIGLSHCMIAQRGLELYIRDACETPEECEKAARDIALLLDTFPPTTEEATLEALNLAPRGPLSGLFRKDSGWRLDPRAVARQTNFLIARLRLLQMAAAARHRFLVDGRFPTTDVDFAPLLPDGPPLDPCDPAGGQLKYGIEKNGTDFFCQTMGKMGTIYSGGPGYTVVDTSAPPEKRTDRIVVPRERVFPFPAEGLRANTAEDVIRAFPNGLPEDPFGKTAGATLGAQDSRPVALYSLGPDGVESRMSQFSTDPIFRIPYDPTNGVQSKGDLFLALPKGQAESAPSAP